MRDCIWKFFLKKQSIISYISYDFDFFSRSMIGLMQQMFGDEFWENAIIEATHWNYHSKSIQMRHSSNPPIIEDWWTNQFNQLFKREYDLNFNLPSVFIGKKHALKKYDQFTLNTSCFCGSTGIRIKYYPSCCAISRNFCFKINNNFVYCYWSKNFVKLHNRGKIL